MTERIGSRTPSPASTITAERIGQSPSVATFTRTLDFTRNRAPQISTRLPKLGDAGLLHTDKVPPRGSSIRTHRVPMTTIISTIPQRPRFHDSARVTKKEWKSFQRYSKPIWEHSPQNVVKPSVPKESVRPVPFNVEAAKKNSVNIFDRRTYMTKGRIINNKEALKTLKPAEIKIVSGSNKKPEIQVRPTLQIAQARADLANRNQAQITFAKLREARFPEAQAQKIITHAIGSKKWIEPGSKPHTLKNTKPITIAAEQPQITVTPDLKDKTRQKIQFSPKPQRTVLELFLERQRRQTESIRHIKYGRATTERIRYVKKTIDWLFKGSKKKTITGTEIAANLPVQIVPHRFKSTVIPHHKHDGTYSKNVSDISTTGTFSTKKDAQYAARRAIETHPAVTKAQYGESVRRETIGLAYSGEAPPIYVSAAQALLAINRRPTKLPQQFPG